MGLAHCNEHSHRESLLREADVAMYTAKSKGKNQVAVFDAALDRALNDRAALRTDIVGALDRGELLLDYQPLIEFATSKVVGVEALVRWQHPTRGLLPPSTFIALAEENGVIVNIGNWVIENAARQMTDWHRRIPGIDELVLSVNISGHQLNRDDFPATVSDLLTTSGLAPSSLVLEVTESVLVDPESREVESLRELRALGVRVALDDFGTGYSSLAYLHRLPIDTIKIDRSFVSGEHHDGDVLLEAIVALGQRLGLNVLPEGIEETSQLRKLQALGCEAGQGFLLSRPVTPAAIESLLRRSDVPQQRTANQTPLPALD